MPSNTLKDNKKTESLSETVQPVKSDSESQLSPQLNSQNSIFSDLLYPQNQICIGSWAWGSPSGPDTSGSKAKGFIFHSPSPFAHTSLEEQQRAFNSCMRKGFRFFDTAEMYNNGSSEQYIGRFRKEYNESESEKKNNALNGHNDDISTSVSEDSECHVVTADTVSVSKSEKNNENVIIATKFLPMPWNIFQSTLTRSCEASLRRLNDRSASDTDFESMTPIDLYQVHGPVFSFFRSVRCWARGLADVLKKGYVKEVGVSNYNTQQINDTLDEFEKIRNSEAESNGSDATNNTNSDWKSNLRIASNQIEYSLLHRRPETSGLISNCQKHNIKILAYSAIGLGRLTDRTLKGGKENYEKKFRGFGSLRMFGDASWEDLEKILKELDRIRNQKEKELGINNNESDTDHKIPLSQIAIAWVVAKGAVPILGCRTEEQADENLGGYFKQIKLTKEEVDALDKVGLEGPVTLWQGNTQ